MIAIDLLTVDYQVLLITYQNLTKKNVQNARENLNLLNLKMMDYIIDAENVKKDVLSQKMD